MIRYIKVNEETRVIEDMISFKHEGYIEIQVESIQSDIFYGYHLYVDGEIVFNQDLYDNYIMSTIESYKEIYGEDYLSIFMSDYEEQLAKSTLSF